MKIEREFRYIGFDADGVATRVLQLATPNIIKFKRAVFDIPGTQGWLRLRTDGATTTLTVKVVSPERASEAYETDLLVGDFEAALRVLSILGYLPRSMQTNFRILFKIKQCEFTVDVWPKIAPLVEIEGESDRAIEEVEGLIEGLKAFRTDKTVTELYQDVGIDVRNARDLDFDTMPSIVARFGSLQVPSQID